VGVTGDGEGGAEVAGGAGLVAAGEDVDGGA